MTDEWQGLILLPDGYRILNDGPGREVLSHESWEHGVVYSTLSQAIDAAHHARDNDEARWRAFWEDRGLSTRAVNSLLNLGIHDLPSLRQILEDNYRRKAFSSLPNLGKKTMAEYDALVGTLPTDLEKLARAVLLFFRGGPWTDEDRAAWREYTGQDEATSKTLGDFARSLLRETDNPV